MKTLGLVERGKNKKHKKNPTKQNKKTTNQLKKKPTHPNNLLDYENDTQAVKQGAHSQPMTHKPNCCLRVKVSTNKALSNMSLNNSF